MSARRSKSVIESTPFVTIEHLLRKYYILLKETFNEVKINLPIELPYRREKKGRGVKRVGDKSNYVNLYDRTNALIAWLVRVCAHRVSSASVARMGFQPYSRSVFKALVGLCIFGVCSKDGFPTPDAPVRTRRIATVRAHTFPSLPQDR